MLMIYKISLLLTYLLLLGINVSAEEWEAAKPYPLRSNDEILTRTALIAPKLHKPESEAEKTLNMLFKADLDKLLYFADIRAKDPEKTKYYLSFFTDEFLEYIRISSLDKTQWPSNVSRPYMLSSNTFISWPDGSYFGCFDYLGITIDERKEMYDTRFYTEEEKEDTVIIATGSNYPKTPISEYRLIKQGDKWKVDAVRCYYELYWNYIQSDD